MISLRGTPIRAGAAMGTGIKIGSQGPGPLPDRLINAAMAAMKRQAPEQELPQIILLCEDVTSAAFVRWPGLRVSGLATRQPAPAVLPPLDVPVVADLGEQIDAARDEDLVIIDGTRGLILLEPDAQTVQRYERMLSGKREEQRFFLGPEHVPAKTMAGRIVQVAAVLANAEETAAAVAEGADELVLLPVEESDLERVLAICGGKPVVVVSDEPHTELLKTAVWRTAPRQVSLVLTADDFASLHKSLCSALEAALSDQPDDALEPSDIVIGAIARTPVSMPDNAEFLLLWPESVHLAEVSAWLSDDEIPAGAMLMVGDKLDAAAGPIEAGLEAIAVSAGLVSKAKELIRSLPPDYVL